jgi:hypothetical protein
VGTFHTKWWTKIFLVIFLTFFGQNIILKGPESLHTKNFIKIPIGKKLGKNAKNNNFCMGKIGKLPMTIKFQN